MDVDLVFITVDKTVLARRKGVRKTQKWRRNDWQEPLLDGPVGRRVAVVDIDPKTGALAPGAVFERPAKGRAHFDTDASELALMQVSVFTTVLRVLDLFEEAEALGRRVKWAFSGEQLLVVPRAGEWANAFYDRESRSLQFFFFTPDADADLPKKKRRTIYTSLSPDIVAHEAGHAVLDAIAPDLYDAVTPQALAMHEAIADLIAAFFTFEINHLREQVMKATGGDLAKANELGWIAEEFGSELESGGAHYLRSLYTSAHLDQKRGGEDFISSVEPHDLSVVLSGAIFQVLIDECHLQRTKIAKAEKKTEFSASGKALYKAASFVRRMLFRGLDYLPPGDASFADLGRAMVAADAAGFPDPKDERLRQALRKEFKKRGVIAEESELDAMATLSPDPFADIDIDALVASDWVAYQFVDKNAAAFCLPKDASFEVRPRLETEKSYYRQGKNEVEREIILKVSWTEAEDYRNRRGLPSQRRLRRGTTFVIDPGAKRIKLRLSSTPRARPNGAEAEVALARSRDLFIDTLVEEGVLAPVEGADAHAVRRLGLVPAEAVAGALRIRGLGRTLHLRTPEGPPQSDAAEKPQ